MFIKPKVFDLRDKLTDSAVIFVLHRGNEAVAPLDPLYRNTELDVSRRNQQSSLEVSLSLTLVIILSLIDLSSLYHCDSVGQVFRIIVSVEYRGEGVSLFVSLVVLTDL